MTLDIRALRPEDWPLLEELFGERGACAGCWCMVWRSEARGKAYRALQGAPNREAFRELVTTEHATGSLAIDGGRAAGWCSAGPRSTFPYLVRSRALRSEWDEHTWSITCFFIDRHYGGRGLATALASEAIEIARRAGAHTIEGYPAVPSNPSKPMPAVFAWTGVPALFEHLGFTRTAREGRPIYVRRLT